MWRLYVFKLWLFRFIGKCRHRGCSARPQWHMAQAGSTTRTTGLACDEHVTRGCCWPFGTTVCADWDALPGADVDPGEDDPVRVAEHDAEMAAAFAAYEAAEAVVLAHPVNFVRIPLQFRPVARPTVDGVASYEQGKVADVTDLRRLLPPHEKDPK